jgi:S-DNA-T family DNA segregation ATPase FtsK/SpoIIIE
MQVANTGNRSARISGRATERPQSFADRFTGQLGVIAGLTALALVAVAFASLATWSVDDPSLSHANGRIAQNAAGFWGASFADLAMQFFGLASVVALVPPAVWGWLKLVQKPVGHFRKRLIAWPLAILLASTLFATFPVGEKWPLPTGLGGLSGDIVMKLPSLFAGGYPSGLLAVIFGLILVLPALIVTLYASGLINRPLARDPDGFAIDPETGEVFDNEDDSGLLTWFMGAAAHWFYTARYMFARRSRRPAAETRNTAPRVSPQSRIHHDPFMEDEDMSFEEAIGEKPRVGIIKRVSTAWERLTRPEDDGLEVFDPANRAEPGFSGRETVRHAEADLPADEFITAPEMAPGYGEEVFSDEDRYDDGDEDDFADPRPVQAPNIAQSMAARAEATDSSRVKPMAPAPKPGNRVVREAQPALLPSGDFELPQISYLSEAKSLAKHQSQSEESLEANARMLETTLEDFGVKGEIIKVHPGPVVTLYELEPAPGVKSSRVIGLAEDIARSMSAISARVAVVPGRNAIGIELPNQHRETVYLRELLSSQDYEKSKASLPLVLGKTIGGEPVIANLAKMPHLLVAGTTGSGKSVAINTMILSILYRLNPDQVKLIMIDPKMLELSIYDGIPHLLTPVVTDPKKAVVALKWTVREMEDRYSKMSKLGVRNIDGYNQRLEQAEKKGEKLSRTIQTGYDRETGEAVYETEHLDFKPMPYIVVVIDEMADLMMVAGKDIEGAIQRLAQMARAAGIHVIMATQRPSVDVITGTIKANFPTRISFQVTSKIDSRTILGEQGAEQLLGMGDMLYMAGGGRIQRVHGPFVSDEEVEQVVNHLKSQGVPQYLEAVTEEDEEVGGDGPAGTDALAESNDIYDQAVAVVLRDRKVSTSYIQRRLGIGYNRAASLIERMEQEGLIGAANHAGKREILVPGEDETI